MGLDINGPHLLEFNRERLGAVRRSWLIDRLSCGFKALHLGLEASDLLAFVLLPRWQVLVVDLISSRFCVFILCRLLKLAHFPTVVIYLYI